MFLRCNTTKIEKLLHFRNNNYEIVLYDLKASRCIALLYDENENNKILNFSSKKEILKKFLEIRNF